MLRRLSLSLHFIIGRGQLHGSSASSVDRGIERCTSVVGMMLLANHRVMLGINPASQGLGDEADDGEEAI